jgi:hypothetical protein
LSLKTDDRPLTTVGGYIYREIRVSILQQPVPEKVGLLWVGCLFPASLSGTNLFFVRVNRFWCVWMRALVFVDISMETGPGLLQWVV